MFKILDIEKNNNIYTLNVYIEIDTDNIEQNIGIKQYFKEILFNENTHNLKIDNKIFHLEPLKEKSNNSINYVYDLFTKNKDYIKKIMVGSIVAISLSTNAFAGTINSVYTYNTDSMQKYNTTMQKNIGENYAPILEDMKKNIVNEFFERYGDKLPNDLTKEQVLDNYIIQLSNNITITDTYSLNMKNVENK